jgi:hypothetical protein
MEAWKSIPPEKLSETDKRFIELFGQENFRMVKVDYFADELYKVREYRVLV